MDNCAVDGWETFKGLTPYFMGLIVLGFWFFQKQKEVLAIEAKEVVKDLLELSIINFDITFSGSKNKAELEYKLLKFKDVADRAHRSMLFIESNNEIYDFKNLIRDYYIYKENLYHPLNSIIRNSDEIAIINFMQFASTKDNTQGLDKCISKIIEILKPYAVYKKLL